MKNKNLISNVVKKNLCTGCGTCVSLCPTEAIKIIIDENKGIYISEVIEEKCNSCGICFKVCPGHEVDFKRLNLDIFEKESENILIGNYINCYVGYSTNYHIRYNSASGGLITALLIFALENGLINGALVTRMKKDKPLEPESFIARTKEEIIGAKGSKYCPVPANIALKGILDSKKGEKFAVVGLPCHIQGIRKAEQLNKKLKEKIVMHLGIFCNHAPNLWATKLFIKRLKLRENELNKLDYRGEGYPGSMKIFQENINHIVPLSKYGGFIGTHFFHPTRCLMCSDGICELADISFGDAWLPEFSDEIIGKSILVSKSQAGEQLLQAMISKNEIELERISVNKLIQSQATMLRFKKKNPSVYKKLFQITPKVDNLLDSSAVDIILALFPYLNSKASSKSFMRNILCYVPAKYIHLYFLPYALICSQKAKGDFKDFLR